MDSSANSTLLSEGYSMQSEECSALANPSSHFEYTQDGVMPIAVVGIGCRFPGGASSPAKFWDMLANGRSAWSGVPAARFTESSFHHPSSDSGGTFNSLGGHFLEEDISLFDAPFFGIGPQEAKAMDPQMRLQLEVAYEALENGGITIERIAGTKTAVYVGVFSDDYSNMLLSDPESLPIHHVTGTGKAIFANRLSYYFDLKGPSFSLDTGCSASLVALHQACQSIRTGESEQALVGGTNLLLSPKTTVSLSKFGFLSDEGRCFSFDSRGSGYGRGEGVACIVIKPLKDALAAGDPIRAVIRNTAVNQDGKTAGITMPSSDAQISMIRSAYAEARLDPRHTSYVEAHGTGTKAGDPIEASAIAAGLAKSRDASTPLIVGSVKTNIGHLESASGLAGLIKAILCLENAMIPPSINFLKQNEALKLGQRQLKISTDLQPFPPQGLRRASVNSFGYGGTNAHAILDGYDYRIPVARVIDHTVGIAGVSREVSGSAVIHATMKTASSKSHNTRVFLFSHRTKTGVLRLAQNARTYINGRTLLDDSNFLDDLAHTFGSHRTRLSWRLAVMAASREELLDVLTPQQLEPRRALNCPRIGFVFTGQGAQWYAMGIELVGRYEVFRNTLYSADSHFKSLGASWSLLDELSRPVEETRVNSAAIGQPLCTALQIALVALLEVWNVRPVSVTGHSSGEIAAAYACGAITFEAALTISYHRGYLASTMLEKGKLRGAMIAVGLSEAEIEVFIDRIPEGRGKAVIACVNSPRSVTVSGDRTAVLDLQSMLEARQVFVRKLAVSSAYHSHHMELVANSYLAELQKLPSSKSTTNTGVTFYSSVTGETIDGSQLDAAYWVRNMVSQVRFSKSLQNLCRFPNGSGKGVGTGSDSSWTKPAVDILLEVGPHSGLAGFVKQNLMDLRETKIKYVTCLVRAKNAVQMMLSAASSLTVYGYPVNLKAVNFESGQHNPRVLIDLPSYPWDHSIGYWHESRFSLDYRKRSAPRHPLLGAPSSDFNSLEPSWRNIIRVSEIPWIRGHVIQSNIVYPAAGYISMAIEASLQRSRSNGRPHAIHTYKLKDVSINSMLLIPDDTAGIETVLSLRPYNRSARTSSDDWDEFRIFSYTDSEGWNEHCRGLVSVEYHNEVSEVEGHREIELKKASHHEKLETARAQCQDITDPTQLYAELNAVGLEFQDCFRSIKDARSGPHQSLGSICIPDTKSFMPNKFQIPHVLHPATLDACMQMTCIPVVKAGALHSPMVPTFIKELRISHDVPKEPGNELLVHSSSTVTGKRSSTSSISATHLTEALAQLPSIEIYGFVCTAVGAGAEAAAGDRKVCHKFQWEPLEDDHDGECGHNDQKEAVQASLVTTNGISVLSRPPIILIRPLNQDPTSDAVVSELAMHLAASLVSISSNVEDIATAGLDGKVCIFLAEMEGPLLHVCTESQWLSIQAMLSSASQVLWITCGGAMDTSSPDASLITGLARSSRSDNEALRLVTLDIDPSQSTPAKTGNVIIDVLDKSFIAATGMPMPSDVEFVEREGRLLLPRLVEDSKLQKYLTASTTLSEPELELQLFFQADRVSRLEVSTPGMLDSLRFVEDASASLPLSANELKMSPRAFGVNFRDVMISLGQLEESSLMSSEHSGIITDVGVDLQNQFHVGDRICAWGGNAYASSVRVSGLAAHHIPDDMSFETAASIPIVYATVYYALVHLARLRKGETVLIHSAAGGVGQAAVMLAQHLGAIVFVTVGSNDKKALLVDKYGVAEDHIFSSRQMTFVDGIARLTHGKGVDVALSSIAGEALHGTCKCVAKMGRFVEIGKRDILANTRLDMDMFNRNITFASVDLTIVFENDPDLAQHILGEVFRLLGEGVIMPVQPLNMFPLSKIESAFRLIQSGKHLGKVVLKADMDTEVKALPRPHVGATFADDASYLVVGGLGGLGRAMCSWMARKKCKNIVLISRSGMKGSEAQSVVAELETLGVRLKVYACDVSNAEELEQTLKLCVKEMPPIRGVIQSAMVIKDSLINKMSLTDYEDALRPKVRGTRNLHRLLPTSLDFFILLSSCVGIIGNNGQANYASACTFQDAFARYCTRLGTPTRSLDLGMIDGAGYVSENLNALRFLTAQGWQPVKLPEFFALLDYAITQPIQSVDDSQLIVGLTGLEQENLPQNLLDAKFTYLRASRDRSTTSNSTTQLPSLQASIQKASAPAEAQHLITTAIISQVSKVLVVSIEDIDPSRSILAYGADSLTAVELRSWFAKELNATVGVMELLSRKSIEVLASEVVARSRLVTFGKDDAPVEDSEEIGQ